MRRSRTIVAVALLAVASILGVFFWLGPSSRPSWAADLAEWIGNGSSVTTHDLEVEEIASLMLRQTSFAGRINIGASPRPGFFNFYAVRRDALRQKRPELVCGCAFVPEIDAVICDAEFLHEFPNSMYVSQDSVEWMGEHAETIRHDLNRGRRAFLTAWLIGHEIGHFALGHGMRAKNAPPWQRTTGVPGRRWGSPLEYDADLFMIGQLQHRRDLQYDAYDTIIGFVKREYRRLLAEQHPGKSLDIWPAEDVTVAAHPRRHPDWILRGTQLANVLIDYYPVIEDTTGYFNAFEAHVRPGGARAPSGSCDTYALHPDIEPIREHFHWFGETELIDRLIANGNYDLAVNRTRYLIEHYPKEPEYLSIATHGLLLSALAALNAGDLESASYALERIDNDATREMLQHDAGIALKYLRAKGQYARAVGTIAEQLPELAGVHDKLGELLEAEQNKHEATPRQMANIYKDLWLFAAAMEGLGSDRAMYYLSELTKLKPGPSITRDIYQLWVKEIARLPKGAALDGASRTDHLLYLRNYLSANELFVEAVNIGSRAVVMLDELANDNHPLRAAYKIHLGRDLMAMKQYRRASASFAEALEQRQLHAAEVTEPAEEVSRAWRQVSIAGNELGYSLLRSREFNGAIEALESSLSLQQKYAAADVEARGAIEINLAQSYLGAGDANKALQFARRAVETRTAAESEFELIVNAQVTLGAALYFSGQWEVARPLLKEWLERTEWAQDARILADSQYFVFNHEAMPISSILAEDGFHSATIERMTDFHSASRNAMLLDALSKELEVLE